MANEPRVKERITIEVDDMVRFLDELHREIERGQYDQAMTFHSPAARDREGQAEA
jgi:hypothetical protein